MCLFVNSVGLLFCAACVHRELLTHKQQGHQRPLVLLMRVADDLKSSLCFKGLMLKPTQMAIPLNRGHILEQLVAAMRDIPVWNVFFEE